MAGAQFRFHAFGEEAEPGFIACDGLVGGAGLHLSHWEGNRTPVEHKRDTSTEMALVFAEAEGRALGERWVTNNHFDSDGALAVFALCDPDHALPHASLLVAAAEAGDFDEWPSDDGGIRLDAAIRALARDAGDDRSAYAHVMDALPTLSCELEARRDLWGAEWDALVAAERAAAEGALEVTRLGRIAVFHHRPGHDEMPGPLLSRLAPTGADRWLLAFERETGTFEYRYERPRHAWADTVVRPVVKQPSKNRLRQHMARPEAWAVKNGLGMTGLLRTEHAIAEAPERVAEALARADRE